MYINWHHLEAYKQWISSGVLLSTLKWCETVLIYSISEILKRSLIFWFSKSIRQGCDSWLMHKIKILFARIILKHTIFA